MTFSKEWEMVTEVKGAIEDVATAIDMVANELETVTAAAVDARTRLASDLFLALIQREGVPDVSDQPKVNAHLRRVAEKCWQAADALVAADPRRSKPQQANPEPDGIGWKDDGER